MKLDAHPPTSQALRDRAPQLASTSAMTMPSLLDDPCAQLLAGWEAAPASPALRRNAMRGRLMDRVNEAAGAARAFTTLRRHQLRAQPVCDGVVRWPLHENRDRARRPGEPMRSMLIELGTEAGCLLEGRPAQGAALRREWLVLRGELTVDGDALRARSYLVRQDGDPVARLHSARGALVYLREVPADGIEPRLLQHDDPSRWVEFGPGIRRRVMWRCGEEAAMLYQAAAGARVPLHDHLHDEECLMLDGELFLDDILLRGGEYQLAPAGTRHGGVFTDTGAVLFAHGDLDLQLPAD